MLRKGSKFIFRKVQLQTAVPSLSNETVRSNHNLVTSRRSLLNRGFCTDKNREWQGHDRDREKPSEDLFVKQGNFRYPKRSVEEVVKTIDTTLTPEQKAYVEKIKKLIKGGVNSPKSEYREVPKPEDIKAVGGFMPNVAPNAEELIDWALSFIPPKEGTRGTRRKKRMALKHAVKRNHDAKKKAEKIAAELRRQKRLVRIRNEVRAMKALAKDINAERRAKLEQQQAAAASSSSS